MKIAVIDLGTNTCNLLIAEARGKNFSILHQSSQPVKLGDGAIKQDTISQEAIERTIKAFRCHKKNIKDYEVDKLRVLATSAVRSALNQGEFITTIKEKTNLSIEVISGEQEADFIYKGVLLAFEKITSNSLILDIGGGSNEFILCGKDGIYWKKSFPTGISRAIQANQVSDPIMPAEILGLNTYFERQHASIINKFQENKPSTLIGCSGAFDTIADIIDQVTPGEKPRVKQQILLEDFYKVYSLLVGATKKELLQIKGMNPVRLDLIVPAMVLIKQTIEKAGISTIYQTDYALREGVLWEKINGE